MVYGLLLQNELQFIKMNVTDEKYNELLNSVQLLEETVIFI